MWAYESVFYQIYPLGFAGAPFENDGVLEHRILKVNDWNTLLGNMWAGIGCLFGIVIGLISKEGSSFFGNLGLFSFSSCEPNQLGNSLQYRIPDGKSDWYGLPLEVLDYSPAHPDPFFL